MPNRLNRMICVVLTTAIIMTVVVSTAGVMPALAVTQNQIDLLKEQVRETEAKKQQLQSQINALELQEKDTFDKKKLLDQQMALTQEQILSITDQIEQYRVLIVQKEGEVQEAQTQEDAQWQRFKSSLRLMEENGMISYISVIFQANSFSDLLARIDFVGEIMQYNDALHKRLQEDKLATVAAKTSLESAKTNQEFVKADLTEKTTELNTQLEASYQLLKKLQSDMATAQLLYDKENAEAAKIQADINKKTEELKAQQQSLVQGTGQLVWPAPSCQIITSPYGMRGQWMHWGTDIGVSYGSDIVAADNGTVIISEYEPGYGFYIAIDHGNGTTTLYGHNSKLVKNVGDTVKAGEVISKSGSTGMSTGPHLHFEVSVNGNRVDPLQFYKNYTFS